jgi:hypothetical protein
MSRVADFDRSTAGMEALFARVDRLCDTFFETVEIDDPTQTADFFKLYDMVLTQRATLSAMLCAAREIGTHGSALVDRLPGRNQAPCRNTRTLTKKSGTTLDRVSPMPTPELWFETLLTRKRQEMEDERG